jgi:hypothetical protein
MFYEYRPGAPLRKPLPLGPERGPFRHYSIEVRLFLCTFRRHLHFSRTMVRRAPFIYGVLEQNGVSVYHSGAPPRTYRILGRHLNF